MISASRKRKVKEISLQGSEIWRILAMKKSLEDLETFQPT
jgi:hypothetical protein